MDYTIFVVKSANTKKRC